eukprot:747043-Hanusia_phi.AAC.2
MGGPGGLEARAVHLPSKPTLTSFFSSAGHQDQGTVSSGWRARGRSKDMARRGKGNFVSARRREHSNT